MSVYKVAQDVEADDKLIGPFSFRQFIYLIIVAISMALAWGLAQVFVGLAIIPLPIILFFGALALPLRKDQPMEIYLAAVISFHLKPKKRIWIPDGIESLVQITAPKTIEVQRTKDLTQTEAERRLSYLAGIVDSEGWAVRGAVEPQPNSSMATDIFYTAQQTEDVLDEHGGVASNFDAMISNTDNKRHQEMLEKFQAAAAGKTTPQQAFSDPYQSITQPATQSPQVASGTQPQTYKEQQAPPMPPTPQMPEPAVPQYLAYNPYPTSMHQSILQPLPPQPVVDNTSQAVRQVPGNAPVEPAPSPAQNTSEIRVDPDIINLANNSDLSVETLSREANRIRKKHQDSDDEVVISLH